MLQQYHDRPVLVSWNAKWCGPCRLMKKELKAVRDALKDDVLVANVDTEKFPSLGARYKVEGLPTVMLFKDGKTVHRIEGFESANEIIRQVRDYL
jgi:thioredoxin 1